MSAPPRSISVASTSLTRTTATSALVGIDDLGPIEISTLLRSRGLRDLPCAMAGGRGCRRTRAAAEPGLPPNPGCRRTGAAGSPLLAGGQSIACGSSLAAAICWRPGYSPPEEPDDLVIIEDDASA